MTRLAAIALAATASTAAAEPAPPPPQQPGDVLASIQHYYATAKQLTATFRQTVTNQTFGTRTPSAGHLYVVAPAKLRFDYDRKKNAKVEVDKSFIFNGTTAWLVDRGGKQYAQQDVGSSPLPVAVAFLTGRATLAADFTISIAKASPYATAGSTVLALVPKRPSAQYTQVFFVVDAKDGHVRRSVIVAPNKEVNDIELFAPDLATPIAPGMFQFDPKTVPLFKPMR